MKRLSLIIFALAAIFLVTPTAYAAFSDAFLSRQLAPSPSSGYVLQTNGTDSTWVNPATLTVSAYNFPLPGNGTSTLTQFNAGVTAYASSTIGNGTATGGLTIFGNATTTGTQFATNVSINNQNPTLTNRLTITGAAADVAINITGITSGGGIAANSVTTGNGLGVTGLTTGNGVNCTVTTTGNCANMNSTNGMTSASFINFNATANMTADYTGAFINIRPVRNVSAAATRTESGNMAFIGPSYTTSAANASILNVTGTTTQIVRTLSNASTNGSSAISVTAPVLSVVNTTVATRAVTDSSSLAAFIQLATSSTGTVINVVNNGAGNLATFTGNGNFGIGTSSPWANLSVINSGSGPGFAVSSSSNVPQFIVNSTGNVGIGSTSPTAALSIAQPNVSTPGLLLQGFANNNRPVFQVIGGNSPNTDLLSVTSNTASSYFNIGSAGGIGISTSTPYARLSVTNTTSAPSFIVEDSTSPDSTPFIIDASGNVGIGTTSPYAQLSLGGGNLVIGAASAGGTPGDLFLPMLGTAAGSFAAFDPTGKLISTTTPSGGSSFAYPFPSNATTSVLTFTNGASIPKLPNLTSNGFVRTGSGDGTLSIDTSTYLTTNQTITLSGDVSGSGNTAITATIGALKVLGSMIANATIDLTTKVTGILPIANGGSNASSYSTSNGVVAYDGTRLSTYSGFTLTSSGLGISSSTPAFPLSVNTIGSDFYVTSTGKIVGQDTANSFTGRISPTHRLALQTGTTTSWTASTTGTAYSPFVVAPFAGSVKQLYCATDTGGLGVNLQIAGSNVTPSYFAASTTVGNVVLTAGNSFTKGQKITANFGTPSASPQSISCTLDVIETP